MEILIRSCSVSAKASPSLIAFVLLFLSSVTVHGEEEWPPEQKEACKILLSEYPSAIEPSFKNDEEKKYWHKLILTDEAIHFSTVSFSKYVAEVQGNPSWSCLYRSADVPIDDSAVWQIEVLEPHPMSSDSVVLMVFISTGSKKVITAWEIPGG